MNADVEVAVATLAEARQTLRAQPVRHAGLRAGLDAQRRLTVRRGDLRFRAQRRLRERNPEVVDEVVAVALEARIFLDVEDRDQIAGRAVARTRYALAPQREVMMIGDARGHVDLNRLLAFHAPVAAAARAGAVEDGAFARAGRTGRHGEELPEQRLGVVAHLATPTARPAFDGLRAGFRAGPAAFGARLQTFDSHRLRRAARDFGERELQTHLDVVPAPPVTPLAAAEQRVEATAETEVSHEHAERFG